MATSLHLRLLIKSATLVGVQDFPGNFTPHRVRRLTSNASVMFNPGLLLTLLVFSAGLAISSPEDYSPTRIRALIADLGSDEFVVRERAEAQLLRIGVDAFVELKQATKSDDVEVAQRAGRILFQFEMIYRGKESESVRDLADLYSQESNVAQKTQYLWIFADPTEYPDGESLQTLCRVVRFDAEYTLRAEAAKCLIASPPTSPSKRKNWFQTLRAAFDDRDDDELVRLVGDYAGLYSDIGTFREEAEKKAEAREKETGTPVVYPVPFTVPEELRDRVRALTDRLAAFQSKPENSCIQPGHRFDILLFHALAELQDSVGLPAERDRTLDAALAVRTEKMRSENPLLLIDPLDELSFSEHFRAALSLERRCRFLWAERHLQLVVAEAPLLMKVHAYEYLWFIKQLLIQYREAVEMHQRCVELLDTEEYRSRRNNADEKIQYFLAAKDYCLARIAADTGNWQEAREALDRSFENNPTECDAVILRYEVSRHFDENDRLEAKRRIDAVLKRIEDDLEQRSSNFGAVSTCNEAAWLLANTDGDFSSALSLIRIAIRAEPESPMYLDTLAHVHVLDKDYKKAVEVQKEAVRLAPEATSLRHTLERLREQCDATP